MNNSSLPDGWISCHLGEYIYLKNGYAFKSNSYVPSSKDTAPIIRISDINGRSASDNKSAHVRKTDVVEGFEVAQGDMLIAMSGATTGKVGVYCGNEPAFQNQRVGNIKLHSIEWGSSGFRSHIISSLSSNILKIAYGGAQPNISGRAIEELIVNLPPLAEQKQIAAKLDDLLAQVDTLKTRLDNIPAILKRFRQSVLAAAVSGKLTEEWRSEFGAIMGDWNEFRLDEICSSVSDGDHQAPPKVKSGIPFLVISNVRSGKIDLQSVGRWVPKDYFNSLKPIRVPEKNDILYTVTGSYGIPVLVENDEQFCFQRHIAIIKPDTKKIYFRYLFIALSSFQLLAQAHKVATGTAQKTVSLTGLRSFHIPCPSLSEQTQIVNQVEKLFTFADKIEQSVKEAQKRVNNLTQSILAKAFRGELTADWREQNPDLISGENSAEALLEKIKAEREALTVAKKKQPRKKQQRKNERLNHPQK